MGKKIKEDNEINWKRTKQIGRKLVKCELGSLKERKKKHRNISNKKKSTVKHEGIKVKTEEKLCATVKEEGEDTWKFQENTIPYKRQRLEEGEANNESHSFPLFPFLSFPPLLNIPLLQL